MDQQSSLRLIRGSGDSNSAARECCPPGVRQCSHGEAQEDGKCAWWINSAQHDNCFWTYIKDKSDANGVMKELVQTELATLFGWSNTKTHFMLKQAVADLTEALKSQGAAQLLEDMDLEEGESQISLGELEFPSDDHAE